MRGIRAHIGMVYEDAALRSSRNVRENLALPLEKLTRKTRGEIAIKPFSSWRKLPCERNERFQSGTGRIELWKYSSRQ